MSEILEINLSNEEILKDSLDRLSFSIKNEYDFAGLSVDLLEKLDKKLNSFNKVIVKDCVFALNIINNSNANDRRSEILIEIEDLLRDQFNKSIIQQGDDPLDASADYTSYENMVIVESIS